MRRSALHLRLTEALRPSDLQLTLLWAGVVGLCAATLSVLFRWCAVELQELIWNRAGDLVRAASAIPHAQRVLVPALGGLAAGLVIRYGAKLVRGEPSTDFMEAVSVGDGTIRVKPSLVKSSASLLSVASGGSIGREGAMVQLSTMFASWVGRARALPMPRLRLLVACGAAAGIASAYNAPIGGALFVAEIVLGSIAMESLGPLVFASVVSTVATRQMLGPEPVFVIPAFELVSAFELGPYLTLGMLAGALAPWFVRALRAAERAFVRLVPAVPARLAVGGLIVGTLSLQRPEVWGNGFASISAILGGEWLWTTVLAVLVCKAAATVATVGSGAVGGVFTPTLFMGAALGALFGALVQAISPMPTAEPSAYALVGMGAFLAGTTHAPLTAILVLFEMTLDYGIVLPLMLACVVAYYTSRAIEPRSIYAAVLARKERQAEHGSPMDGTIRDLVRPGPTTVPTSASFADLVKVFVEHRHNYVYVVDDGQRFLGAVALHDIKAFMADPSLSKLIIASEIMNPEFPYLDRDASVGQALDKLLAHDGERIPVVDGGGGRVLVGTISKRDVLLTVGMRK
ncbi:MAG: ClcB-like voltage-gated chloride channel protein [Planctomycetes bacterium]|nr:ClcB-like voltage-gated chloride channel protein [Planctomycetota bacterium]